MTEPLLLYSTNTTLAYTISEQFYGGIHYVWCSRYFNRAMIPPGEPQNPPSSLPERIYQRFEEAAKLIDFGSNDIRDNVTGLHKGVVSRHGQGIISNDQRKELFGIINDAKRRNLARFMPLLYVIPFPLVKNMVYRPTLKNKANSLSNEYIISGLPRDYFDVVDLRDI